MTYKEMQKARAQAERQALRQMKNCRRDCKVVPACVLRAVLDSYSDMEGEELPNREARTLAISKVMSADGWRFCACYRHERTPAHALIYAAISTVSANRMADEAQKAGPHAE